MNSEDIIRMAREAGLAFDSEEYPDIWQTYMYVGREEIERFAALVAAAEREECAALCEQGIGDWRLGKRVSAAIRERGKNAHR